MVTVDKIGVLKEWLASPKRIAITTHQRPDGDAMGSSLGLYHYLTQMGHKVDVVAPTEYAENLKWIPGTEKVIIGPLDPDAARWAFEGADIIFCLDFNSLNRIGDFEDIVSESEAKKVLVDHHLDPKDFADLDFIDSGASSTAELVYRIIMQAGDGEKITISMAEALYAGLMTDTGSFRFSSTTRAVHEMAGHLVEIGANMTRIYDDIFSQSSINRLKFFGYCFSNCLKVLPEYKTAYIVVDKKVFKEFFIKPGETEGLVNYALGIKGVNLGILITVQEDLVKLSFRSRNEVSASDLAKNFDGGGHFYAAGGRSTLSIEETEKKLIDLLEANKAVIAK